MKFGCQHRHKEIAIHTDIERRVPFHPLAQISDTCTLMTAGLDTNPSQCLATTDTMYDFCTDASNAFVFLTFPTNQQQ